MKQFEYNFDAKKETESLISKVQNWFEENGKGCNAVIGISGGKDSSICAALCARALGAERVIGVLMPNGTQKDIDDSKRVVECLGIKHITIPISEAVNSILNKMNDNQIEISEQSTINLPPRIRMSVLYAVSQSNNGRVINTCNLSEDWVGYSTRYGDAAGDVSVLGNYTVHEVKMIGRELSELPIDLVDKTPSDGLCGKSDEDNLGFTYETLDRYIRTGICEDNDVKRHINYLHCKNAFKLKPIPVL